MTPRPAEPAVERRTPTRAQFPHSALATPDGSPITIAHLSAEYYPYARSGGLAEAVANLARFQSSAGMRSLAFLPLYRVARQAAGPLEPVGDPIPLRFGATETEVRVLRQRDAGAGTRLYFIEHDGYFDREKLYGDARGDYQDNHLRYACFALGALAALPRVADGPVLLHAHDWHAAVALVYLRSRYAGDPRYARIRTVLSVHNAGYQGHYPPGVIAELGLPWDLFRWDRMEWYGKANLLKGGLSFADQVVTVSPNHVRELRTPEGGFGLQEVFSWLGPRFSGILNGIDQQVWNPATDGLIPETYTADDVAGKRRCKATVQRVFGLAERPDVPLFSMAARLVTQKGIDLILQSHALLSVGAQFVFIGAGESRFEEALASLAARHPDRIAVNTQFTDRLEHLLISGADFLLMPCQYEPCGLTQMRAQRYGAIPVVRRVGGLADTVEDGVTGFSFEPYHPDPLLGAALRGLDCYANPVEWSRMRRNAMGQDWGWERSVEKYLEVYRRALDGVPTAGRAA